MRLRPQQLRGGVGSGDGDGWWTYRSLVVVVVISARVSALVSNSFLDSFLKINHS